MTAFENGFALLVGVDENQVAQWALPTVKSDLEELRKVLVHPERCAYPEEHVKLVRGRDATRQGVLDGLDWLEERLEGTADATAVVYYSGHGFRDPAHPADFYLVPYDVKAQAVPSRSLRAQDFASAIAALAPKRLLVVLDCCHAGGMNVKDVSAPAPAFTPTAIPVDVFGAGEKATTPVEGAKGLERLAQGAGRAVLSSSRDDQPSSVRKDGKLSLFTYHLIEALTGHAQPQEGAREVLVSDVMSHVYRKVPESARAEWNRAQDPQYQVTGNFPVALLLGGQAWTKGLSAPDPLGPLQPSTAHVGDVVHGPKVTTTVTVGTVSGGQVVGTVLGGNTFVSRTAGSAAGRPGQRKKRRPARKRSR